MKRAEAGFGSTQTHMFLLPRTIACFQHGALFASRTELRQCLTASHVATRGSTCGEYEADCLACQHADCVQSVVGGKIGQGASWKR